MMMQHSSNRPAQQISATGPHPRPAGSGDTWLNKTGLADLARTDRLRLVLVRMHGGRFICPAQDAASFIEKLEAQGDMCRDVSLYEAR